MNQSPSRCAKCAGEMEQGFVLDNADRGGRVVSRWAAGAPQKSVGTLLKAVSADSVFPIGTLRCKSCGYLESYARPEFAAR